MDSYLDKVRQLMEVTFDAVNYEDLAKRIVRGYAKLLDSEAATLWRKVVDETGTRLELAASYGIDIAPGEKIPSYEIPSEQLENKKLDGITSWIAIRRQPCIANSFYELAEDENKPWHGAHAGKWNYNPFWSKNPKTGKLDSTPQLTFGSLLGISLVHEDNLLGVLKAENRVVQQHLYNKKDLELALHLAPFIAMSIAGMEEREKHERDRQQVLRSLSSGLLEQDPAKFYQQIVDTTATLLQAKICSLWLVDETKKLLKLGANYGVSFKAKKSPPTYNLKWEAKNDAEIQGTTAWVAIRRVSFFASNFETLRKYPFWRGKWDDSQWGGRVSDEFGSLYAVPLIRGDEVLGVLKIENDRSGRVFDEVDRATFDLVGDFVTLAIELSGRLRSDVVFDFFHLLKQPTANATMTFEDLQRELSREDSRSDRIDSCLEMLSKNLATVRVWTMNVYGLATARSTGQEDKRSFNLEKLITENVTNIQRLFPQFSCEFKGDPQDFTLSLTDLERKKADVVFYNILDNCNKFSGKNPKIIVDVNQQENGILAISIRDHGLGISPEALPRIFDPYYTTSIDEWPESMGMGLSTVNSMLEELYWDKKIWSEEGKGTEITIYIPRKNYKKEEKSHA